MLESQSKAPHTRILT